MLSVIVNNTAYSIDDETLATLEGYDNVGMSPVRRFEGRGSLQHGSTDKGFRLDPRLLTLYLRIRPEDPNSLESMYVCRNTLLGIFKPNNALTLRFDLGSIGIRQIEGVYYGDMVMNWKPNEWAAPKIAVTVKCPDPLFYDPEMVNLPFPISGGGTALEIPLEIPFTIGASDADASLSINYVGTFLTYPIVEIEGPITNPVVENETTGNILDFTGLVLAAGEKRIVDCRFGEKTVVDESGTSALSDLTDDSDLETFCITDQDGAGGKVNILRLTGTGITSSTQARVQFYTRYIGL